jgi:uncharacterized LabA/DUF88 family protein
VEEAVAGRSLVRALAYVITTESRDEQNFFGALEKMGIEIKTKDLQTFVDGSKKADWDVAIAVDAIRIAERVDVVVIASGDGDFIPLVQHLQHMGVQVEIVSFGNSVSSRLREEADIFTDLAQDTEKYLIQVPTQRTQRQNTFTKRIPHAKVTKQHTAPEVTEEAKQPVEQNKKPDLIPLSDKNYTIARKLR